LGAHYFSHFHPYNPLITLVLFISKTLGGALGGHTSTSVKM
jgi:hypothetical protein